MVEINIDTEKCNGCGTCVDVCPVNMYSIEDGKSKVTGNLDDCVLCRACETSCPENAIEIIE
ncbi:MAG TPA: 4Fe-4S dicluster domain-containing protein [Candidatus Altiarchaeales archaeon]|nr:MAG: 4Fe-4S ferredoxin [Candidatus Altiarchaeales archaeon]HDN83683.1 4Fe-4S dicluster domain-containing protein [Candidatus Altiarchaeales archaeon]